MGKTILGIGYILSAIPYVNFIGIILVAIGWYTLGKDRDKGLWKATGVLGIITFILIVVAIAVVAPLMFAMMIGQINVSTIVGHGPEAAPAVAGPEPGAMPRILAAGIGTLAVLLIAFVLLIIFGILQLVCLWQFGDEYNSSLAKIAVILYIIAIVAGLVSIPFMILAGPGGIMLGLIGVGILSFIAGILAGIGILVAKEQAPAKPPATTELPPPPPQ